MSDAEVRAEVEKQLRSWNLDFLKFSPSKYPAAEVSAEEISAFVAKEETAIKAFYDSNKTSRFVKGREVRHGVFLSRSLLTLKMRQVSKRHEEDRSAVCQGKSRGRRFCRYRSRELGRRWRQGEGR